MHCETWQINKEEKSIVDCAPFSRGSSQPRISMLRERKLIYSKVREMTLHSKLANEANGNAAATGLRPRRHCPSTGNARAPLASGAGFHFPAEDEARLFPAA